MLHYVIQSEPFYIQKIGKQGRGYIQSRINEFNNMSNSLFFFILTDLDGDSCAPDLLTRWLQRPVRDNLLFRIAVREVESWLMADIEGLAEFLNLKQDYIKKEVNDPDKISNPKEKLISLADRSNKKNLKIDIVRKEKTFYRQGPGYNTRLSRYVNENWNIENAISRSDSLNRAVKALRIISSSYM